MAKKSKKGTEEINNENEFLKLKMMAEFGGDFVASGALPPEVENQFLKQISKFHKLHEQASMTTIYAFIGSPEYNHVMDMNEKEIPKALKQIRKLLAKKNIKVDSMAGTSDYEMYRFITEEVFKQEMLDIRIPNWNMQILYEDYYPNPEYEIKVQCLQACALLFEKHFVITEFLFAEEMKSTIGLSMERDELLGKIDLFKVGYNQLELGDIKIEEVHINHESGTASAVANVLYRWQLQKGKRFKIEQCSVEFNLTKDEETGMWLIEQLISDKLDGI